MTDQCPCASWDIDDYNTPPKRPTWEMPYYGLGFSGGRECPECGFMWGVVDE